MAVEYMRSCFNEMLEDEGFFNWLSAAVGFKAVRLRNLLSENRPNNRNSKLLLQIISKYMIFGYNIQSLQLTLPTVRSVSPRWHFCNDINILLMKI